MLNVISSQLVGGGGIPLAATDVVNSGPAILTCQLAQAHRCHNSCSHIAALYSLHNKSTVQQPGLLATSHKEQASTPVHWHQPWGLLKAMASNDMKLQSSSIGT